MDEERMALFTKFMSGYAVSFYLIFGLIFIFLYFSSGFGYSFVKGVGTWFFVVSIIQVAFKFYIMVLK